MIVWIYLFAIVLQHNAVDASKPPAKCVRSYKKVGCFFSKSIPLNELLITNRDRRSPKNDGHVVDWNNYGEYTHSLACRCAAEARTKDFKVFGLQDYAECWSGPGVDDSFDDHIGLSNSCLMVRNKAWLSCETNLVPTECIGGPNVNFIYKLVPDVDECAGDPCQNGATCQVTVGGFQCKCPAGFTGKRCELDEDECKKSPCKNGGSCVNTQGSFTCDCRTGFKGNLCEQGCVKHGTYDLGFLIDGYQGIYETKMFLVDLINQFHDGKKITTFGIVACSKRPKLICKFRNPLQPNVDFKLFLKTRVLFLEWPQCSRRVTRTDNNEALRLAENGLYSRSDDDPNVTKVLVVIADSNTVLQPLKDREVNIIAIGVGNNVSKEQLIQIAKGRKDRVISVSGIQYLDAAKLHEMIEDIC